MSVGRIAHGYRAKFYSMQDDSSKRGLDGSSDLKNNDESEKLVKYINDNIIGKDSTFLGPYGKRKVVYCDYYGSGRALQFIEDFIQKEVLPSYGADLPSVSHTSLQSNIFREEARSIIRDACRCSRSDRVVLGGSLQRLARLLRSSCSIVFMAASDERRHVLPWEDTGAKIVRISETREGFLDLNDLETKLQQYSVTGEKLIGCFGTASRVTGALVDTVAATLILHQYGALSVWCHSLAGGWSALDMNPGLPGLEDTRMVQKDAVVFSCGKMPGGLQTPTILIINKAILNRESFCHNIQDDDIFEECDLVEAVRAGLVMQLREAVGQQAIVARQESITRQVLAQIRNTPELILLGGGNAKRVPIFPLLIRHPRGAFLHHNFVSAVLSDVFGVQASSARCSGEMLGIDDDLAREYAKMLGDDGNINALTTSNEHLRPGFCRVSIPYFISDSELAFVLEALKMVATEAWKILPQYTVDSDTGRWVHRTHSNSLSKKSLSCIAYRDGKMIIEEKPFNGPGTFPQTHYECLQTARNLFNSARKSAQRYPIREQDFKFNARADYLRWYMLPMEAQELLLGNSANVKHIVPFDPVMFYSGRKSIASVNSGSNSPVPSSSPRHYSLSAIDTSDFAIFNNKFRSLSRESSIVEASLIKPQAVKMDKVDSPPVQFAVGEEVTPAVFYNAPINKLIKGERRLSRTRCHSLGSDSPPMLPPQTRLSLGMNNSYIRTLETCNCSSQTDLQSLDDYTNNSSSSCFMYTHKEHESNSDCSQLGRASPTASVTSHNSEDLHAYVKEMTKEIATEIKSEIREVISRVEDVLENTEPIDIANRNFCLNNNPSIQSLDSNSVSITDVAEYLMGVSREMASEVKNEIREMVNQVDEMISPEVTNTGVSFYLSSPSGSRKNSPPELIRRNRCTSEKSHLHRVKSVPSSNLAGSPQDVKKNLRKSPTSPVLMLSEKLNSPITESDKESLTSFRNDQNIGQTDLGESPQRSPDSLPHDIPCTGSVSFNSSDTSSPDTIIQVLSSTVTNMSIPKSISSHKLSDDENSCTESECQQLYCKNRVWYHNNSVSSQDSGINMSFLEHDHGCSEAVKKRPSSDSSCYRRKRSHNRFKNSSLNSRQEKSEVPDIIEGVPACSDDYRNCCRADNAEKKTSPGSRVEFQIHSECEPNNDNRSNYSPPECSGLQRVSRISTTSSDSTDMSRKSSYNTDSFSSKKSSANTVSSEDYARCSDMSCCQHLESATTAPTGGGDACRSRLSSDSSSGSDCPADYAFDEDGKWHCPPKAIWKGTVEGMQEFGMIRHQDRVLVCLSGGAHSLSLLHTLHQYQFYARAKGIHFTIGAVTIRDGLSDIDPLHLMSYCKSLGIKYIYQDNMEGVAAPQCVLTRKHREQDLCSFTNHWTRRQIYRCASEHGYNVIATGQHLDDVARSFIISVFSNGRLRTMKAHYYIKELNLRVIRPFIYVREKNLNQFVESRHLPQFKGQKQAEDKQATVEDCLYMAEGTSSRNVKDGEVAGSSSAPEKEKGGSSHNSKVNRSLSAPCGGRKTGAPRTGTVRARACSAPCGPTGLEGLLESQEAAQPGLFTSLKAALHPLISARNIERDMKEYRHRKRSVIQMKNGAPVYNSDDGTDEEPVP